jgi:hypothetical protein
VISHSAALVGLLGAFELGPMIVVSGGPRPGDIESGTVAGLTSAMTSVVSGGLACVVGVGLVMLAFPQLAAYGVEEPQPAGG